MKKQTLLFTVSFMTLLSLSSSGVVSADKKDFIYQTECGDQNIPYYTADADLKVNSYEAYVKLGQPGQTGRVTGYATKVNNIKTCQTVGTVMANGGTWTRLGIVRNIDVDSRSILQLSANFLENIPNASRPQIMLVPSDNPICVPVSDCKIRVGGGIAILLPSTTLRDRNSLYLLNVSDPGDDTIERVDYFVNGRKAYTTKNLQSFDMRYAATTGQLLERVVMYSSGQRVMYQETVPSSHTDTFGNFLFRTYQQSPYILTAIMVLGVIVVLYLLLMGVARFLVRKRQWAYGHGLVDLRSMRARFEKNAIQVYTILQPISKFVALVIYIPAMVVGVILIVNSFVVTVFTVNGDSMDSTFHTDDKVLVNKLPRTIADLGNTDYIPKRGEVIIVDAVYGFTSQMTSHEAEQTIIKRVIGLPGERVSTKDGKITVYNTTNPEGFDPDKESRWDSTLISDDSTMQIDIALGPSELFVVGDNRPMSVDSRYNGPIQLEQIVGTVVTRK